MSSVHQIFEEKGVEEVEDKGEDMLAGVKGDLVRIPGFSMDLLLWDAEARFRKRSKRHSPSTKYPERHFTSASQELFRTWLHRFRPSTSPLTSIMPQK